MYEGTFETDSGERISICQMAMGDILDSLRWRGIEIVDPSPGETEETVRERLEIELIIRRIDAEVGR